MVIEDEFRVSKISIIVADKSLRINWCVAFSEITAMTTCPSM